MDGTAEDWVVRAQAGDSEAFRAIVDKYASAVYGIAYAKVGDHHTAQDITQEVLIKVYRNLPALSSPERLGGWLHSIAVRTCQDWFRVKRPAAAWTDEIELPDPDTTEERVIRQELRDEVWNALGALSAINRSVLVLYYIDEYKIREIAEWLGLSVDAAESRLRRSRLLLKKEMLSMVGDNLNRNKPNEEFKRKVFEDARMSEAQFRRVVMGESDFDDIDLSRARFHNINMHGARFDDINMSGAVFHNINMKGASFREVGLWEIEVAQCCMGDAYFHDIGREGQGSRFERCDLAGTSFLDCNLANADIRECDISGLRIEGIPVEELLEAYRKRNS
ncbi:sigma-70 family RNA polymerase sigma factor [Cohnella fermenti]|uniref:Sigma-70 family RNA polymerase sigma factor n=1 Tax=Cohnella fermenti TaxID=2565925 RepID=A0A4S4BHS3_9BACL|nr:sigma-70 family RNA polymerase sigma factor [Cohnella fermenti]THF74081.1 sigma-70 family RNA polymerase sigma factor [Cohnella fermenti]